MEEKNKITEQEQFVLNNLFTVLNNYNIPKEIYLINDNYQHSEQFKICLIKTKLGDWNTCLQIYKGIYDSIYHPSILTAIIKFIQCVAEDDEQSIIMIQEFLNLSEQTFLKNNSIKSRRKKL